MSNKICTKYKSARYVKKTTALKPRDFVVDSGRRGVRLGQTRCLRKFTNNQKTGNDIVLIGQQLYHCLKKSQECIVIRKKFRIFATELRENMTRRISCKWYATGFKQTKTDSNEKDSHHGRSCHHDVWRGERTGP